MRSLLLLSTLALLVAPSLAADLSKIDRSIAKQPAYHAKAKYCLAVFGPKAKTRVWLVLDGKTLYVDRNGDGDLTGKNERFTCKIRPADDDPTYPFAELREFPEIETIAVVGKRKYTGFEVMHTTFKKEFKPDTRANRELQARFGKDPTFTRAAIMVAIDGKLWVQSVCEWTDSPKTAPVIHVDGPLTLAPIELQELIRGGAAQDVRFCLGTRGVGKDECDAFAIIDYTNVPKDVQPVARFEFQNRDPDKPPITVDLKLKRC